MLTDGQWAALEPLIETCRPPAKAAPKDLCQTISAIKWRHQNGAKWRAVPEVLGPWWKAAQTFIRWARLGVWKQLLILVQKGGVELGMTFLDGTNIRAHQKAAGAPRKRIPRHNETSVRRWARLGAASAPRPMLITDAIGRAVAFVLAPGQDHELPHAISLLNKLPGVPKWVVADRGYSSHAFREHIWNLGARPVIPTRRNEETLSCPSWIYTNRNQVERLWARLKEWRAIATRYEKTARSFMGILCLAAACDWIKR